jgi:hypothetical protein
MANINLIEDANGDVIELEYFCSDGCAKVSDNYAGWYGCHEIYAPESCQTCGVELGYYQEPELTWEEVKLQTLIGIHNLKVGN